MKIQFQTPHQYVFSHRNAKHLLLLWKKERKRELYLVDEDADHMLLTYPGETYIEMILQEIEPILIQQLQTDGEPFAASLVATFEVNERCYACYIPQQRNLDECYFFELCENQLVEIPDENYEEVVQAFMKEFSQSLSHP